MCHGLERWHAMFEYHDCHGHDYTKKKLSKIFPLKRCSQKTFKMHFGSTQKISSQQLPVGCQVKTVANFCSSCAPSRFLRSGFDEGLPEGGKFGPTISGPCCAGTWWLGKFIFVLFFEIYIYIYILHIFIYICLFACITQYTPFASTKLGKILVATTENLPSKWHWNTIQNRWKPFDDFHDFPWGRWVVVEVMPQPKSSPKVEPRCGFVGRVFHTAWMM